MEQPAESAAATSGRRFAKDVGGTVLTQALTLGLGLALSAVVVRLAGFEGQGLYSLLVTNISLASLVFALGQDFSCIYLAGKRRDRIGAILGNSTLFCVLGSGVGILATAIWGHLLVDDQPPEVARGCLRAIEIALPLACLFRVQQSLAIGMRRVLLYNVLSLVNGGASLAGVAAGLFLGPTRLLGLLIGWNAGNALSALVSGAAALRLSHGAFAVDVPLLREGMAYSLRACAGNLAGQFFTRVVLYVLKMKGSLEAVGYFWVALLLAETLFRLPAAASPILNSIISSDPDGGRTQFAAKVIRHVSLLVLLAGAGVALGGPFVIPLVWGRAAVPAVRVLWILLPGIYFSCMHMMFSGFLAGRGYPMVMVIANVVGIATDVGLCLLWIPVWHMVGAAFAVSISYLAGFISMYVYMRSVYKLSLRDLFLLRSGELAELRTFLRGLTRG